jgi:hypothetical protein
VHHRVFAHLVANMARGSGGRAELAAYLAGLPPLIARLQVGVVQHFRALLPALRAALVSPDAAIRESALRVLETTIRFGWPRIPPHQFDGPCLPGGGGVVDTLTLPSTI